MMSVHRPFLSAALWAAAAAGLALPAAAFDERVKKPVEVTPDYAVPEGKGAILVRVSRPDDLSRGRSLTFHFARYDRAAQELDYRTEEERKADDETTRAVTISTKWKQRKEAEDWFLMEVSPGDYVLTAASPGPSGKVWNNFCMGAPVFSVEEGEVVYFGDLIPYARVRLEDGRKIDAAAYASDFDTVHAAYAPAPAVQEALVPAEIANGATYSCFGNVIHAYAVPGAPDIATAAAAPSAASPDASTSEPSAATLDTASQ